MYYTVHKYMYYTVHKYMYYTVHNTCTIQYIIHVLYSTQIHEDTTLHKY